MKNILAIAILTSCLLSCTTNNHDSVTIIDLNKKVENLIAENQSLKDTIKLLQYPASDRFKNIKTLVEQNKLVEATKEIKLLRELFPLSEEAKQCAKQEEIISDKKEKIAAEQARVKALGFKALKEESTVEVFYNKISIGAFSTASTFTFDAYDDSWFLFTADRGNKYISARITITSKDKNPKLPVFYAYRVAGDKLECVGSFILRFARWEDYATYLGNYNDNSNDFSKTATIPFKIGIEVSNEIASSPLIIVCRKQNCMIRHSDRFSNPPISYSIGDGCTYDEVLTLESIKKGYAVVKILNKNKL